MEDKDGVLARLQARIADAELVDMSSVRIGDILYVPLDEDDGLTLTGGYDTRKKYICHLYTLEGGEQ